MSGCCLRCVFVWRSKLRPCSDGLPAPLQWCSVPRSWVFAHCCSMLEAACIAAASTLEKETWRWRFIGRPPITNSFISLNEWQILTDPFASGVQPYDSWEVWGKRSAPVFFCLNCSLGAVNAWRVWARLARCNPDYDSTIEAGKKGLMTDPIEAYVDKWACGESIILLDVFFLGFQWFFFHVFLHQSFYCSFHAFGLLRHNFNAHLIKQTNTFTCFVAAWTHGSLRIGHDSWQVQRSLAERKAEDWHRGLPRQTEGLGTTSLLCLMDMIPTV